MPYAVTHVLVPIIIASIFRDWYNKRYCGVQKSRPHKTPHKKISLHYVLIAGLAGLIPDLDVALFIPLHFLGFAYEQIHRTAAHSLLVPISLALIGLALKPALTRKIGRHQLKPSLIFFMLAFGSFTHLILDAFLAGPTQILYPFYNQPIGFAITSILPTEIARIFFPSLDAALLAIWLAYLEFKHKISDFI